MELLIKYDEIGYISKEDDQSFGFFCPVVQIYDDAIAAQLVEAWNSKASPASAPVAAPDYRIADRGFRWDAENRQHIPQLLIEFAPVPANEPNDSNGWKDRDKLAEILAALAEQNEKMRKVLLRLACLGNGDQYGNSIGNCIAQEALSLPDLATPVLNKYRAEGVRMAAEILAVETSFDVIAKGLFAKADELEAGVK